MTSDIVPTAPGSTTILIIDDTPANLGVVVEELEGRGFRVTVAQEGEEGLQRAEFVHPDIILLDVMMPGIGGFETCRRLKASASTRDIPVIFMTALADTHDKIAGFSVGGADYITKPFHIEEATARISTHLALSAAQKRLAAQNVQLQQEVAVRQRAEMDLQDANDALEMRVTQRTAELVATNDSLKQEIMERQQAEGHIRFMAHHDALTGLPNRALLEDRLNQAIAQARRHPDEMVGVLYVDLDYFKIINDSLGHRIGDCLLKEAAARMERAVRESDSVARLGADEYVVCLAALTDSNHAAEAATKLLECVNLPFVIEGHELHVSASIGISLYPVDGNDGTTLISEAGTAMYHAKEKGRGNYQFFTAALHDEVQRRVTVTSQLRRAIAQNEFAVYYQPQVDMETGQVFSAEALLRWSPPGQAPISCAEFIGIAEETGLILPIGEWVLREACAQLKRWHDAGHTELHMAVNLSARQFFQPDLTAIVAQVLKELALPASALELEITESMLMQPSQDNMAVLAQLSAMGVQLSIDDFGTGYSNLSYLQRFPIHALKIDRSFVIDIDQETHDSAIITAIIAMAHSLRLKVIAEGVDSDEQICFLRARGCLAAQGFYYSQAVPAEAFSQLLEHGLAPHAGSTREPSPGLGQGDNAVPHPN
jgi:diguanylate cyclase (GGDEF)-like protein